MSIRITIINGPNLNLLGSRETDVYGNESFENYLLTLKEKFKDIAFQYIQSNIEGGMIDAIQAAGNQSDAIILNPAGYTHTSVAIGDAIAAIKIPVVEVHISNIFNREEFRKISHVSAKAVGVISGLGLSGYELAVIYFCKNFQKK
ncbi:MAG TPA: type II 3-dehydroquinate dehydratase [Ferruginibacter sp.]|nr:type II 3-dehydroquinate dehydratase [Ferruginibacter sp.]